MAVATLHWGDILTMVLYFVLCIGIGLWSARRTNQGNVKGYFLAGKGMMWLPVGASIFSTNVGSQFFIGMAGTAAVSGIAVVIFEWHAIYDLMLLGWFYLPVYIKARISTTPEYLKKRFGGRRMRVYFSVLSIVLYIMQGVSVTMYSGGVFIQQSVGWDLYLSTFLIIAITAIYTIIGGLAAVIYADTMQTVIMVVGCTVLTVKGLIEVGGFPGLYTKYNAAVPNVTVVNNMTCGLPRHDAWNIMRDPINSDFPWPAITFGLTIPGVFVWCNDQVMVQRVLAAKNLAHARGGAIFGSYLKLLPILMMVIPGMISRALFPDEVACVDPDICMQVCQNPVGCSNIAYPKLVVELLPAGLRGLMIASVLAALMSSLTSVFNSSSSMFTMDIWRQFRKQSSEFELMIVGRLFIIVLVVVSYLWIPILQSSSGAQLWVYLQAIGANLLPPWFVVFGCGILWKRANETGAFWSLMVGLAVGVSRMILDFVYQAPACGEIDRRPAVLARVHFFYFALILAGVCLLVIVVVSLLTQEPDEILLRRVTWWTRNSTLRDDDDYDDVRDVNKRPSIAVFRNKIYNNLAEEEDTIFSRDPKESALIYEENKPKPEEENKRRRCLRIVCCLPPKNPGDEGRSQKATEEELEEYMQMDGVVRWTLRVNALLVLGVTTFLIIWFR
ncbi:sodium/mannose cotransporter SLC5A10-like [Lineus longissimus]|uniref:sodium/mannose cotransporter SLC5A10-like n=1 Tax=Lineus longissimus TaxID=88925 RepID=UPI002B4E60DE